MRFIKLALISVVFLFIVTTSIGLLLPSTVRVTRNITIHASHDSLYSYINNLQRWKLWLAGADSVTIKFNSANQTGKSADAFIGNQGVHITQTTQQEIETLWYNKSNKSQKSIFQFQSNSLNNTNLNWYFEQQVGWLPWERLPTLANDKILGPVMESSLDKLKVIAEK